jgi:curved DNA-binding protein CbpA
MEPQGVDSTAPLAELVRQKQDCIESGDLYALLGVPPESDANAIRTAYFALAKLLHPDVVARQADAPLQQAAAAVFKGVSDAYGLLSDRRRRADFDRHRLEGRPPPQQDRVQRDAVSEARIYFHKGSLLLQRRAYAEADACFRRAVELDGSQAKYMSNLGLALMSNETLPEAPRMEEARQWFERAVALSKREDADVLFAMSLYFKAKGETNGQRRLLAEVLRMNNRHVDALREVRLLSMRSRPQSDLFSGFKRMFERLGGGDKKKKR